jgi:predicted RNA-binding Zn-ribbon protein involved in translation (DUF1610 family)
MASNFQEKYRSFMSRRNGPDDLGRDLFILGIVLLLVGSLFSGGVVGSLLFALGIVAVGYAYYQMFSTKVDQRRAANRAYVAKRGEVLSKVKAPFSKGGSRGGSASAAGSKARSKAQEFAQQAQRAANQAQKAANQAKAQAADKDHKYYGCPSCGQKVRVPKGAGKIRVTCPKCGTKFEKKA